MSSVSWRSSQDDPLAEPLLAELAVEYASRYGGTEAAGHEMAAGSIPPRSSPRRAAALLIGLLDGHPVTGGAFRRFDDTTAELKRIWTDSRHRRRGHAKALLVELEREIVCPRLPPRLPDDG